MNRSLFRPVAARKPVSIARVFAAGATLALCIGALAPAAAGPASAASVPVVSADVKIQSIKVTSTASGQSLISLTQVVIQNDNDDDARNVELIITLPPTSHILSAPAAAVLGPSFADPSTPWRTTGHITIDLGTLAVRQTAPVSLTTEMRAANAGPSTSIAAFAFSDLPDPDGPSNVRSALVLNGV